MACDPAIPSRSQLACGSVNGLFGRPFFAEKWAPGRLFWGAAGDKKEAVTDNRTLSEDVGKHLDNGLGTILRAINNRKNLG